MSQNTGIEWTDSTWNPVVGCRMVSEGCRNCYAKSLHDLRHKAFQEGKKLPAQYAVPFEEVQLMRDRMDTPLHWKKPRRIFVNSVSDLFHDDVPDWFIDEVIEIIRKARWHTFQVLTKRPERMFDWYQTWAEHYHAYVGRLPDNLWLGVSVENQKAANERLPYLMEIPNVWRFVSCEPLLDKVNLRQVHDPVNHMLYDCLDGIRTIYAHGMEWPSPYRQLHWVIAGGESGKDARPMHADWARKLRDDCQETGTLIFFKQWGEWLHESQIGGHRLGKKYHRWEDGSGSLWVGKAGAGNLLDGREWRQLS